LKAAGFCSIAREKSNFRRTAINLLPQVTRCRLAESYYFWPASDQAGKLFVSWVSPEMHAG